MKISELIIRLYELKSQLGDVEVKIAEIAEGANASDRYGIGMGLLVGNTEITELQDYVQTGCLY